MTQESLSQLLHEFEKLPKTVKHPTYLEICRYPRRRFEEICSRILSFYLDPMREHKLKDLFISSLLQLLAPNKILYLHGQKIGIKTEENAEGKRVDLLLHSELFVIGIENKITAPLYNPLQTYKKRIELYSRTNAFGIVLSLHKLKDKDTITYMNSNNFVNLTYEQYFHQIKQNLSSYQEGCNEKYLHDLYDFIKTIENMTDNTILNKDLECYFYDNSEKIESLLSVYNEYKNKIKVRQIEQISELKERISELTGHQWWTWQDWDLGFNEFNTNVPKIGIEGSFEATKDNPLGIFTIFISTWSLDAWNYYEINLLKDYPNCKFEKNATKAYLVVDIIENGDEETIINKLKKHHDYLVKLTKEVNGSIAL